MGAQPAGGPWDWLRIGICGFLRLSTQCAPFPGAQEGWDSEMQLPQAVTAVRLSLSPCEMSWFIPLHLAFPRGFFAASPVGLGADLGAVQIPIPPCSLAGHCVLHPPSEGNAPPATRTGAADAPQQGSEGKVSERSKQILAD